MNSKALAAARAALQEAPWEASLWPEAVRLMAEAAGFQRGHLIGASADLQPIFNLEGGLPPGVLEAWERAGGTSATANPRAEAIFRSRHGEIIGDDDFIDRWRRERHPLYQEVYAPYELDAAAVAKFPLPDGGFAIMTLMRKDRREPLAERERRTIEMLLPRLAQATGLQLQLELRGVALAAASLDQLGVPAWFCDRSGVVRAQSAEADAICRGSGPLRVTGGRLQAGLLADNEKLQRALSQASAVRRASSLLLSDGARPHRVEVTPMRPGAVFDFPTAAVVLRASGKASLAESLRELGLTAAESQVAEALGAGHAVAAIAHSRRASVATVRAQIRSIYEKLGVNRQAQLVATLRTL